MYKELYSFFLTLAVGPFGPTSYFRDDKTQGKAKWFIQGNTKERSMKYSPGCQQS